MNRCLKLSSSVSESGRCEPVRGGYIGWCVLLSPVVGAVLAGAIFQVRLASAQSDPAPIRMFNASQERRVADPALLTAPGSAASKERAMELNEQALQSVFQGRRDEGVAKIKEALQQDPRNPTILYNLAGLYLAGGEPEKAVTLMREAVEILPDDLPFQNRLGEAYIASNQLDKASTVYEKICSIDPTFNEAVLKLGTLYAMKEDYERAEQTLKRGQQSFGENIRFLANLGNVLVARHKFAEAVPLLKKAQNKSPSAENAVALGICHESLGEISEALSYYQQAKSLGEKGEDLESHIEHIQRKLQTAKPASP